MTPYTINTPSGKKVRVTHTKCLIINDIHQHIRVVHLLDQVGLDFDVISVVLDKYRDRLSSLPKPLPNFFETLKNRNGLINRNGLQDGVWRDGRSLSINRVFQEIYHSNLSPFVSGDLNISYRTIPRGFKGSVMENWSLIDRLNNTMDFTFRNLKSGKTTGLCRTSRNGRVKPFNYKLMDKVM